MLDHEKLDVYQQAIEFVAVAVFVAEQLPRGYNTLSDQLRRAAFSIPLNIAEGIGKVTSADRARYHAIARGSAMECGAIMDVVRVIHGASEDELSRAKELLFRVVSMLSKMCR